MKKSFILFSLLTLLFSCARYKDVPYFQNAATFDGSKGAMLYDMTIKPKDELTIFVSCPTDKDAVAMFNRHVPLPLDISDRRVGGIRMRRNTGQRLQYLVENDGCIEFPVIGKIKLEGLTIEQANKHIEQKIAPYVQSGASYQVNTIIDNFEVTVMGEVKSPNTFTVTRNKMTILEALAKAGDMTIYGRRDNVKLLRQQPDGEYSIHEIDMRDANIINSPYYYLQQRDVVYVEPNVAMCQNAEIGTTTRLWLRGTSITIRLGSLLYRVLR